MSPVTTYGDAETFTTTSVARPRRSFARWMRLEGRASLARLRRWRKLRADLRALNALDDRMLSDIGLDRGRLDAAVHGRR